MRGFRPHVVLTYDENGGYPHPDHVKCHEVTIEAFDAAGDPDRYPGAGEPWQPLKLYYFATFRRERVVALHEEMQRRGLESPYAGWIAEWDENEDHHAAPEVTTRIDCAEYFAVRDQALLAHATQIDPGGWWFAVPLEIQRAVWPTEDYQLARSLVDTEIPEDDLFAGVREKVGL
jgi:mycothiol S-conjugate amidase